MSEPYLPVPDPDEETTALYQHSCPTCGTILQALQPSLDGSRWKGWCPVHDWVHTISRRRKND